MVHYGTIAAFESAAAYHDATLALHANSDALVRQQQSVVLETLSLVVASTSSGLVQQTPVGPAIGVRIRMGLSGFDHPDPTDFVAG
jgi:hypothetical protein